ncbi:MAG TPA: hypothetical protein DEQ02_01275 [Ruminococcaceae bacterium]|nr:hypothetical protein [Oscillospiraceae bacterium]
MDLKVGQIVIAKAGREKDRKLVVVEISGKSCFICDGKERPLEAPKRKNVRHIAPTHMMLTEKETATNRALRRALAGVGCDKRGDKLIGLEAEEEI